ncbi:angiopoietin-2 [Lingula anatina]|uniref:Angiopoietin-2 n=1 Tax=Lingula anatina TaxID=7574 RepID=A0A1S3JTE5_LINAN|nr:angiopoietin-2 [Lingula anatina]|eukprot:XP_013413339.1 angiopoietin-2 [Lingula anatina]
MSPYCLTLLLLLVTWLGGTPAQSQSRSTCASMEFRKLSPELQNEHTCLLLEQIKQEMQQDKEDRQNLFRSILGVLTAVEKKLGIVKDMAKEQFAKDSAKALFYIPRDLPLKLDCMDLLRTGKIHKSGVYPLRMDNGEINLVRCDMDSEGGGWTVIQRRADGSVNFTRFWNEYKEGFGDPNTEFWLGLEKIHRMTNGKQYGLRIDMWDWEGNKAYAFYEKFVVDSEEYNYRLHASGYHGTAGDSINTYHDNVMFSTPDSDNDDWYGHCAKKDASGWWFKDCSYASLNGQYNEGGRSRIGPDGLFSGIHWYHWKEDYTYSLKQVEMKIKPIKDF